MVFGFLFRGGQFIRGEGKAPSLKHAATGGIKQWCHHHHPTGKRNDPREESAGKAMLQKPGERGRKQSLVVGWFLPSSLPWKCSVMERCLWSTVVHCGRGRGMLQWCTAQPARARSDGSVLCSASEGRGLPRSTTSRSLAHHSHPTHDGLILAGLGCVRLQKHTPAVLPVPGACGSCGRDSRPSTTSTLSTVYSNVGLALFWASCCTAHAPET